AANRALLGLAGVGRSEQLAHACDDVLALESHDDDRTRAHELLDFRVEVLVRNVGLMLTQLVRAEPDHLGSHHLEAGALETIEHRTHLAPFHAVRLKNDERLLHNEPASKGGRALLRKDGRSAPGAPTCAPGGARYACGVKWLRQGRQR